MLLGNRLLLLKIIDTFYVFFQIFLHYSSISPKGFYIFVELRIDVVLWKHFYIGDVLPKSLLSYQRFKPKDMTNRLELNSVNHSAFVDVSLLIFMKIYHIHKMIKPFSCCKLLVFLLQQTSWLHIHRFRIQGVFWRICHLNNDEAITRCNHICREMPKSSKSIVFFHLN